MTVCGHLHTLRPVWAGKWATRHGECNQLLPQHMKDDLQHNKHRQNNDKRAMNVSMSIDDSQGFYQAMPFD